FLPRPLPAFFDALRVVQRFHLARDPSFAPEATQTSGEVTQRLCTPLYRPVSTWPLEPRRVPGTDWGPVAPSPNGTGPWVISGRRRSPACRVDSRRLSADHPHVRRR